MTRVPNRLNDAQLKRLLADIQSTTEVDITFGGLMHSNYSSFAITRTHGARTKELRNLAIHNELGLGGKAISLRRPVWVQDYPHARGITHHYDQAVQAEQLRAIFAIPLIAANEVWAVVYGALRQDIPLGDRTFSAADLAIGRCVRGLTEAEGPTPSPAKSGPSPAEHDSTPLLQSLRTTHDELVAIAAEVTDSALRQQLNDVCERMRAPLNRNTSAPAVQLSPREIAVLAQVAEGCKNSEIAERLDIVPGTVKAYLESTMRKLGTNNRMLTVNAARQAGLLP